jgi:hypothetical protein
MVIATDEVFILIFEIAGEEDLKGWTVSCHGILSKQIFQLHLDSLLKCDHCYTFPSSWGRPWLLAARI